MSHRIITYTLITWYVSNFAIFWVCGWDFCVCACVSWSLNRGCVSVFLHTSWVHAKCCGQNSQTIRVYAHTYNMYPLSALSPVTRWWVQSYCAYKYCMNFSTHFIFICESWLDFFQIHKYLDQLIWKNLCINLQDENFTNLKMKINLYQFIWIDKL